MSINTAPSVLLPNTLRDADRTRFEDLDGRVTGFNFSGSRFPDSSLTDLAALISPDIVALDHDTTVDEDLLDNASIFAMVQYGVPAVRKLAEAARSRGIALFDIRQISADDLSKPEPLHPTETVLHYWATGSTEDSISMPELSLDELDEQETRLLIPHTNKPNAVGIVATMLGKAGINIESIQSDSKDPLTGENGPIAYSAWSLGSEIPLELFKEIKALEFIVRPRIVRGLKRD